jgi:cyclohexanecarboxyl-CoA dehydrogenase
VEFSFSAEEESFRATVRRFAQQELRPHYADWDLGQPFPRERVKAMARLGLAGMRAPAAWGGQDASFVQCGIAAEEVGRADFNCTLFLQIWNIWAELLRRAPSALQEQWFPPLVEGEKVFAFALTEPEAGSDAAAVRTRAERDGDFYILEGEKASITFAGMADVAAVFARTGGEGPHGISCLAVPLDLPGISRSVYRSAGERLSQRGSLFFSGVRVPAANLIGEEGQGFRLAMGAFDFNRAVIGLACIGAALQSLGETIEYLKARRAFGRPLATFQGVSFQVVEHLTRAEAARLLCYRALWLRDQGLFHAKEAAMAKWFAPMVAVDAIRACIVLHGHYGYSQELPLEQRLRDVLGLEIGDGTPEVMKLIVAREVFGRDYRPY